MAAATVAVAAKRHGADTETEGWKHIYQVKEREKEKGK